MASDGLLASATSPLELADLATPGEKIEICAAMDSPLSLEHKSTVISSNNSSALDELYQFITNSDDPALLEELWVESKVPFGIKLTLRTIRDAVKGGGLLDSDSLNLAVRMMVEEDVENFQNTNCLGWRHFVYQDWAMYAIRGDSYRSPNFTGASYAYENSTYDVSRSRLVLIPVLHNAHWTLYAFNMSAQKLSILDSLPNPENRHEKIRPQICDALDHTFRTKKFDVSKIEFSRLRYAAYPQVPQQRQGSNDCGFLVFKFMRLWDGHQLTHSVETESQGLRKDFLAYILSRKENIATNNLPQYVASWINNISEAKNMARVNQQHWTSGPAMDNRLLEVAREGSVKKFGELLNLGANGSQGRTCRGCCSTLLNPCKSILNPCKSMAANELSAADNTTTDQAARTEDSATHVVDIPPTQKILTVSPLKEMPLRVRGVTSSGDGVLHIAARHGHEALVRNIFHIAGLELEGEDQAFGSHSAMKAKLKRGTKLLLSAISLPFNSHRSLENAAQPRTEEEDREGTGPGLGPVPRAEEEGLPEVGAPASSAAASESSRREEVDNALVGGEGAAKLAVTRPAADGTGNPQQQHREDGAAHQGTRQFTQFLRARNHRGETCLHEAVRCGHTTLVRLLIQADARLNDTTSPALVQILDDEGVSPLYLATTLSSSSIVKCLTVSTNIVYQVSHVGPGRKTALHAAVLLNTTEPCDLLLKWKWSLVKERDDLGRTPLHYLGRIGTATIDFILENDESSSAGYYADSNGSLPIHVAALGGRLDIIKKLLKKYPNCDVSCDASGQTFLHVAVHNGHGRIVKYMCTRSRFSTVLNMRDYNGDTALHLAVQKGDEFIFWYLLRNKSVHLSFINKQGRTPLDLAILSIKPEMRSLKQRYRREWIRDDLLVARSDFSTCRWDDYLKSRKRAESESDDDEKESERISKSAGLLAAGALLILTASLQAPFNIADKNLQSVDKSGIVLTAQERADRFAMVVRLDSIAVTVSVLAVFFCTIAGFPTSRFSVRYWALGLAGTLVCVAFLTILLVFALGLPLVYAYPEWWLNFLVYGMLAVLSLLFFVRIIKVPGSPGQIRYARVFARIARIGFPPSPVLLCAGAAITFVLGCYVYIIFLRRTSSLAHLILTYVSTGKVNNLLTVAPLVVLCFLSLYLIFLVRFE